jgi:signal transduction histidine kinase
VDPAAARGSGLPTVLLFWFSRLSSIAIAGAVLIANRRHRLRSAERMCSQGLAAVIVVVLVGGGFVILRALAPWLPDAGSRGIVVANVLATALAAMVFQPVSARAQRVVGRLLYGRRPTPYQVLADVAALSRTLSTGGAPNFAGVAEAIGRGLGAQVCQLTVLRPGLRERTYSWSDYDTAVTPDTTEDESGEDELVVQPIRQGMEQIGTIAVDRGALGGLHDERRTLLIDVADSLGAILQTTRLGIELERQLRIALAHADEIAVSRRQGVAEMDSERRRIERDLHDGAQHHLVSLRLSLGLVEHELASGKPTQARERLDVLGKQTATAEAVLEQTASGVSSVVLAERGLAAALTTNLSGAEPRVALDLVAGRFPPEAEAAVFYCCLESVNNARKHAGGAPVAVRLRVADGALRFTVRDEGPGFEPSSSNCSAGRGLANLGSRIRAVGGNVTIESAQGSGTVVDGFVPLPTEPGASSENQPGSVLTRSRAVLAAARAAFPGGVETDELARLAGLLDDASRTGGADGGTAAHRARTALRTLVTLIKRAHLDKRSATDLLYQIEAIQSSAAELVELDVVDALRSGALPLVAADRAAAERLLGLCGTELTTRLGLPDEADAAAVLDAAGHQLAHWRRLASHPATTSAMRDTAELLARTCEHLVATYGSQMPIA